ncbi:hypothetical protein EVAR_96896_1 [Eumeta japonica]|uniref:Uncharacterized protein n=1 Tax=Eumeta variegata TaxID=151549 RepID=A0A4C1WFL3_EUMVA|nr:hypothetical protein EVAR_96896_1 [Eumeta japonica]
MRRDATLGKGGGRHFIGCWDGGVLLGGSGTAQRDHSSSKSANFVRVRATCALRILVLFYRVCERSFHHFVDRIRLCAYKFIHFPATGYKQQKLHGGTRLRYRESLGIKFGRRREESPPSDALDKGGSQLFHKQSRTTSQEQKGGNKKIRQKVALPCSPPPLAVQRERDEMYPERRDTPRRHFLRKMQTVTSTRMSGALKLPTDALIATSSDVHNAMSDASNVTEAPSTSSHRQSLKDILVGCYRITITESLPKLSEESVQ